MFVHIYTLVHAFIDSQRNRPLMGGPVQSVYLPKGQHRIDSVAEPNIALKWPSENAITTASVFLDEFVFKVFSIKRFYIISHINFSVIFTVREWTWIY